MSSSKAVDDGAKLFPFPIQLTQFKYFLSQTIINETSNQDAGTPLSLSLPIHIYVKVVIALNSLTHNLIHYKNFCNFELKNCFLAPESRDECVK